MSPNQAVTVQSSASQDPTDGLVILIYAPRCMKEAFWARFEDLLMQSWVCLYRLVNSRTGGTGLADVIYIIDWFSG